MHKLESLSSKIDIESHNFGGRPDTKITAKQAMSMESLRHMNFIALTPDPTHSVARVNEASRLVVICCRISLTFNVLPTWKNNRKDTENREYTVGHFGAELTQTIEEMTSILSDFVANHNPDEEPVCKLFKRS